MNVLDQKNLVPAGVSGAMYIAVVAIFASLIYIVGAASTGLILGYLFPATFGEALTALGLGKFALWQVNLLIATASLTLRPLFSLFK